MANTAQRQLVVLLSSPRNNFKNFTDPGDAYFPGFFQMPIWMSASLMIRPSLMIIQKRQPFGGLQAYEPELQSAGRQSVQESKETHERWNFVEQTFSISMETKCSDILTAFVRFSFLPDDSQRRL